MLAVDTPCIETTYWRNKNGYGMVAQTTVSLIVRRLTWRDAARGC